MSDIREDKSVEIMEVRGLCAAVQAMAAPTFTQLGVLLAKLGYSLVKK